MRIRRIAFVPLLIGAVASPACGTSPAEEPDGGPLAANDSSRSGTGSSGGTGSPGTGTDSSSGAGGSSSGGGATGADDGGSSGPVDSGASSSDTGGGDASSGACGQAVAVPATARVPNGNPILPPKWAFGVLYGSYFDQVGPSVVPGSAGNLMDAAQQIRDEYSGDLMWIDSSWLYHVYTGAGAAPYYIDFKFDSMAFPDPATMLATLRQNHFHFGVWEWPWIDHQCALAAEGQAQGYFKGTGGGWHGDSKPFQIDFTNPAAVTWWMGLNQPLVDMGLDFLKLDTGYTGYRQAAFEVTRKYSEAHDPDATMNGGRGFILTHTSPAPSNDQTPGMWTGDNMAGWAGMQAEMKIASGLNNPTQAPYWTGDTAGYNMVGQYPDDENYIRWFEYSAFTPLQEIFGSKDRSTGKIVGNRFPFNFGPQAQALFKTYTALRYRLLPFRYSNGQAMYHEKPVKYAVAWNGATQFVLQGSGDSQMLVQPVTAAAATMATVSLPAGTWIHYWTGAAYTGSATVPAPLDQEPIFVKAGTILPMGPALRWVDEVPADPLTLDYYPGAKAATSYTLYEDDGISQGYLGGAFSTTKLSADDSSGKVTMAIAAQQRGAYDYHGRMCSRTYILKINQQAAPPAMVTRDGAPVTSLASQMAFDAASAGWFYDAAAKIVWVKFPQDSSQGTSVKLQQ